MSVIRTEPAGAGSFPDLEDLFGRGGASNGCWCMYWRIGPRYRERPRYNNRDDMRQLMAGPVGPGVLAYYGNLAVGWCAVAPRANYGWLTRARHLAAVDDLSLWSVPCFYVRRTHRGTGITGVLIEAAADLARSAGAPALEAYPIDTEIQGHTENLYPGVASTFAAHGFDEVARRRPDRPIMRRRLVTAV